MILMTTIPPRLDGTVIASANFLREKGKVLEHGVEVPRMLPKQYVFSDEPDGGGVLRCDVDDSEAAHFLLMPKRFQVFDPKDEEKAAALLSAAREAKLRKVREERDARVRARAERDLEPNLPEDERPGMSEDGEDFDSDPNSQPIEAVSAPKYRGRRIRRGS